MTRVTRVRWTEAFRAINSRYPPVDVFEHVADPSDWDALLRLEEMTNPRLREEWGEIARVPPAERPSGPGSSWIMSAFTHIGWPSRFSDGTYGVYYAARALETAVRETAYHFGRFLGATAEPRPRPGRQVRPEGRGPARLASPQRAAASAARRCETSGRCAGRRSGSAGAPLVWGRGLLWA